MVQKNREISVLDSNLKQRDKIDSNYVHEIQQINLQKTEYKAAYDETKSKNAVLHEANEKQTTRKRNWRTFALTEAGLIAIVVTILVLL